MITLTLEGVDAIGPDLVTVRAQGVSGAVKLALPAAVAETLGLDPSRRPPQTLIATLAVAPEPEAAEPAEAPPAA